MPSCRRMTSQSGISLAVEEETMQICQSQEGGFGTITFAFLKGKHHQRKEDMWQGHVWNLLHPCCTANQSTHRVYTLKPEKVPHHLSRLRPAVEYRLKEGYHEGRENKTDRALALRTPPPSSFPFLSSSFLPSHPCHSLVVKEENVRNDEFFPPSIKKVVNPKENPFIVRVQTDGEASSFKST